MSATASEDELHALHSEAESTDTGYERDEEQVLNQRDSGGVDDDDNWTDVQDAVTPEISRAYSAPEPLDESSSPSLLDETDRWVNRFPSNAGLDGRRLVDDGAVRKPGRSASIRQRLRSNSLLKTIRARMDDSWPGDWTSRFGRTFDNPADQVRPYWPRIRGHSSFRRRMLARSPSMLLQNLNRGRELIARKSVEAASEAAEFISSPTLLFRPAKMAFALTFPLVLPLLIIPWRVLLFLIVFYTFWYLVVVAIFASEVTMRPPWYRLGQDGQLPMVEIPSYWRGVCHDPKKDLQLEYISVAFETLRPAGVKLRGWYIPASNDVAGSESATVQSSAVQETRMQLETPPEPGVYSSAPMSGGRRVPKTCVVCVHGAGRDRRTFLRHAAALHRHHYDLLLFDLSEHGLSDGSGRGTTFGVREKYDVLAAVAYARQELHAEHIILLGTSAGASSCLLAAAEWNRLDPHLQQRIAGSTKGGQPTTLSGNAPSFPVRCIIAENPLARPEELFLFHLERLSLNYLPKDSYHLARRTLFWLVSRVLLFRLAWLDIEPAGKPSSRWRQTLAFIGTLSRVLMGRTRCGAVDVVPEIHCPLFVMHGTGDEIVPVDHGMRIFAAANEPRQLWLAPDAAHCALYDQYQVEWESRVVEFIEHSLDRGEVPEANASAPNVHTDSI